MKNHYSIFLLVLVFLSKTTCLVSQTASTLSVSTGLFLSGDGFDTNNLNQTSLIGEYQQPLSVSDEVTWHIGASIGNSSRLSTYKNAITNTSNGDRYEFETNEFSFVRNAFQVYTGLGFMLINSTKWKYQVSYSIGLMRYNSSTTGRYHTEVYLAPDLNTIELIDVFHRIEQIELTRFTHGPSLEIIRRGINWNYGLNYRISSTSDSRIPPLSSFGIRIERNL